MVLFTKVYGELSLRIQQSLPRCNNRGAFQAHAGAPERQEAARPGQRDAQRELIELGKFATQIPSNSVLIFSWIALRWRLPTHQTASAKRARSARQRSNREQEVVELN